MVTGGQPFEGESVPEVKKSVMKGKFRVPYYISYDCENLIRSMLSMEPNKRPSVSSILSHKWIKADTSYREKVGYYNHSRSEHWPEPILTIFSFLSRKNCGQSIDLTVVLDLIIVILKTRSNTLTKPLPPEVITDEEDTRPASPSPAPSKRVINRPHSLDKVIHSARAFSAIFHKSGQDHDPHLSTNHNHGKKNSKTSPLVSSLISPRRITDNGAHSPRFFNRTMFAFGPFSKTPSSSTATQGGGGNANLGSQSARSAKKTSYPDPILYGGAIPHLILSALRSGRRRQTDPILTRNPSLFREQLLERGSIDTKPIKQWLRCEVITDEEDTRPASPSPAPSKRVINRPHSLDKVIHSARAFSAIFHKSGQDHDPHLSTNYNHQGGKKNSKTSPLVSSLISPRRITDNGAHSPRFFNRTMFAFGPFSKTPSSSTATQGGGGNANLGSQSARGVIEYQP
eukprot:sb/3464552/